MLSHQRRVSMRHGGCKLECVVVSRDQVEASKCTLSKLECLLVSRCHCFRRCIIERVFFHSFTGTQNLGKAQGVYVASSADGSTQMMAFTAMFEGGEYGDSLNFFGVFRIGSTMSRISVTGGTGKFKNACGFAEIRSLIPAGQHITDGAETLLRIVVHLTY